MSSPSALYSFLRRVATQAKAFERREQSRAEIAYGTAMGKADRELTEFTRTASFDQMLVAEKAMQTNDLAVYARAEATLRAVREGIADLKDGEVVYRQLQTNPEAYKEHRYREKERAAPDRVVPLDAMRKALRGQAARVENYRKNVMGNLQEQAFLTARVAMLRRAERLYDGIQRDLLLPPE